MSPTGKTLTPMSGNAHTQVDELVKRLEEIEQSNDDANIAGTAGRAAGALEAQVARVKELEKALEQAEQDISDLIEDCKKRRNEWVSVCRERDSLRKILNEQCATIRSLKRLR